MAPTPPRRRRNETRLSYETRLVNEGYTPYEINHFLASFTSIPTDSPSFSDSGSSYSDGGSGSGGDSGGGGGCGGGE